MARRPVVGGNWKCNPTSKNDLGALIENINACDTSGCDVYVCPSPLHVDYCIDKFTNGAMVTPQNCNFKGIFPMDNDDTLATKLKYILDQGLSCVYCIGEPLSIREEGIDAILVEMDKQRSQIYSLLGPAKVVIAYEPVWAIGTGVTASPEQAQETHAGIRKLIAEKASPEVAEKIRIQYGGSANPENAPDLSAQPDIDGFLVGGASLKPEFKDIVAAIAAAKK